MRKAAVAADSDSGITQAKAKAARGDIRKGGAKIRASLTVMELPFGAFPPPPPWEQWEL